MELRHHHNQAGDKRPPGDKEREPSPTPASKRAHHEAHGSPKHTGKEARHLERPAVPNEPAGPSAAEDQDQEEQVAYLQPGLPAHVLAEGKVTFMYKPRVQVTQVQGLEDVSKFHMLLEPLKLNPVAVEQATRGKVTEAHLKATEHSRPGAILITVGKKRLPSTEQHERFFSFVSAVGSSAEEVTRDMGESQHETKTLGTRTQAETRVAARGVYMLCTGEGIKGSKSGRKARSGSDRRTYLAYTLELPLQPGPCQDDLQIAAEGELAISIKNPGVKGEAGVPSISTVPDYTPEQLELFSGLRWIACSDPRLLEYKGTELLLIGGHDNLYDSSLGDEVIEELHHARQEDLEQVMANYPGVAHKAEAAHPEHATKPGKHHPDHPAAEVKHGHAKEKAGDEAAGEEPSEQPAPAAGGAPTAQVAEQIVAELVNTVGYVPDLKPMLDGDWE